MVSPHQSPGASALQQTKSSTVPLSKQSNSPAPPRICCGVRDAPQGSRDYPRLGNRAKPAYTSPGIFPLSPEPLASVHTNLNPPPSHRPGDLLSFLIPSPKSKLKTSPSPHSHPLPQILPSGKFPPCRFPTRPPFLLRGRPSRARPRARKPETLFSRYQTNILRRSCRSHALLRRLPL